MRPGMILTGALGLAAAAAPLLAPRDAPQVAGPARAWPRMHDGRRITPLPPAPEDALLGRSFPGQIARFSDGRRQIVLRRLHAATRRLHPASDCFRATGHAIAPAPMRVGAAGPASCFVATRGGRAYRVCEQVTDAAARSWPDVSSWYWSALLGTSRGPWLTALTVERVG